MPDETTPQESAETASVASDTPSDTQTYVETSSGATTGIVAPSVKADVTTAINFTLKLEDSRESGVITHTSGDSGGRTRYGIAENSHPELTSTGYFDFTADASAPNCQNPAMPNAEALEKAIAIYTADYANPLRIAELDSQDVANRFLAFGVNSGNAEAVMNLKRAIGATQYQAQRAANPGVMIPMPNSPTSSTMDEATVTAVNDANATVLLSQFKQFECAFYEHIVTHNPKLQPFLKGWINRANA